jgi:hypothetical protein
VTARPLVLAELAAGEDVLVVLAVAATAAGVSARTAPYPLAELARVR